MTLLTHQSVPNLEIPRRRANE